MMTGRRENRIYSASGRLVNACAVPCKRLWERTESAKDSIIAEFQSRLEDKTRMLVLALNEAEALAFETEFPLLVFPTLAREKAESVAAWNLRQRSILQTPLRAFAA